MPDSLDDFPRAAHEAEGPRPSGVISSPSGPGQGALAVAVSKAPGYSDRLLDGLSGPASSAVLCELVKLAKEVVSLPT